MEYDYGQIIQYIDGSWDENFNEARRWCKSNKATFDELIERRKDGKRYFQINKIPEPEPAPAVEPKEPTYAEKRAAEYPDIREYLDAQVKIASGDDDLATEGHAQLDKYVKDCLAVKAKYPKPIDTDNVFF